ncbi:hypothetical protein O3M35_010435 [Rhynocoris fuscipes]|uniref:Uncharacterized protein n=1 Tax=Rhynocoris fuscipes TaxID=488301 RepID=A0AAW1CZV2_9HEMI
MYYFILQVIYNYWTSLLIIIAILLIILLLIKENRGLPPGPWSLPIVGYLMFIDGKRPYISLTELCKKYGPICHIKLGCVRTVVLSDPAIIKEALSRNVFTARANLYLTHGIMGGYGKVNLLNIKKI